MKGANFVVKGQNLVLVKEGKTLAIIPREKVKPELAKILWDI